MNAENRPYIGVAVIVVREGRVLLGKRKNAHGAGTWQFPGGHLEYGESIESCARRELFEETGMTIVSMRRGPFTNDFFENERKHYVTLFMIADQTNGEAMRMEPDKCDGWEWFPWSELPKPHFLPVANLLAQHFSILPQPSPAAFIKDEMAAMASPQRATVLRRYFKTGPGEYAEGDVFIGVRVPELRKLVKKHRTADMVVIEDLLRSPVHEHRQAALFLLIQRFRSAGVDGQAAIVDFYLSHTEYVNNWDLVDCSAHAIVGAFLLHRDKGILYRLVRSPRLWERRIAIVATWHFIRAGHVGDTLKLAARLLADTEDLIHKSVGWMLREVGKQDESALLAFLEAHYRQIPRTTLRYAIERFPQPRRRSFLKGNF